MESLLYILLGIVLTFIAFNLKSPGKLVRHTIRAAGPLDSDTVQRSIGRLLGPPLLGGNRITTYRNGDEIFPAMLSALGEAQKSITMETFIYWSGDIGRRFADVLSKKAREGVKVHVILDWMGSRKFEQSSLEEMRKAGVELELFRPLKWYNFSRLNNRTHRKILVVDGCVGFTGGVGIADQWQGKAQDPQHWRDSHFKFHGPAVGQLQAAFMDNWNAINTKVLHGDDYFPACHEQGPAKAQVFQSSPEGGSDSVRLMYLYSFAHARESILIANAYFVPDEHVREELVQAIRRGVRVEVIVPGKHIDTFVTRRASRALWGELLKAGVRIFEYQPTMFHCKYMIVDGMWASVGSTNMDNRSFRLNDECNLNVLDAEWAKDLEKDFEADKKQSREVTWESWSKRPMREKALELVARLVRTQV